MGRWYKWAVVALLGGAYFFHQADRAIFGVLVPYIQSDLSLTERQLGHVNTVLFLTIAVVTFIAGFIGDRFDRKRIITCSLVFWSLSTMGIGFASSFLAVVMLRSVATGGGESFYGPSAMSLLASHHRETRSLAFSIHQAALYLGLMLSGVLALRVLDLLGTWRRVFSYGKSCSSTRHPTYPRKTPATRSPPSSSRLSPGSSGTWSARERPFASGSISTAT